MGLGFTWKWAFLLALFVVASSIAASSTNNSDGYGYCFSVDSLVDRGVSRDLAVYLNSLQCHNQTQNRVKVYVHAGSQGYGVQFISYYAALSDALNRGLTFELEGSAWNYSPVNHQHEHEHECSDSGIFCYVDRVLCRESETDTGESEGKGNIKHAVMLGRSNLDISDTLSSSRSSKEDENRMKGRYGKSGEWKKAFQSIFYHIDLLKPPAVFQSVFNNREWEGQMATAMFCPTRRILERAQAMKEQWEWNGYQHLAAVHIRRTDRVELKKFTVDDYIDGLATFGVPIDAVYLATDDPRVIDEFKRKVNVNMAVLHLPVQEDPAFDDLEDASKPMDSSKITMGKYGTATQKYKFAHNADDEMTSRMLLDVHFLSEAMYFVGAQHSLFSWVASRILLGKHRHGSSDSHCPIHWVGNDVRSKYGYWSGNGSNMDCV